MDTFLKTLMHHITVVVQIKAYLSETQKDFLLEETYMVFKYHQILESFPVKEDKGRIFTILLSISHMLEVVL